MAHPQPLHRAKNSLAQNSIANAKKYSPACDRNKEPILQSLLQHLPANSKGKLLEIASGTGQHVSHFAPHYPDLVWQPSECSLEAFQSITAYASGIPNICIPPLILDTRKDAWPLKNEKGEPEELTAIYCANMCHISPWEATQGLLRGAGRHLKQPGSLLIIYGPFKRDGQHTSESNAAFDESLRQRNLTWGYRDVSEVEREAASQTGGALKLRTIEQMPANNLLLVFERC